MKMEPIEGSETSAIINQTPGNYPKGNLLNINQITFYFAKEGPGCGSEDIKKGCNVNCFDFCFFSVFLMDVMSGKITVSLKEQH